MRYRRISLAAMFLLVTLLFIVPFARAASISLSEYRQQLQGLSEKLEALQSSPEKSGELLSEIPDHVSVATAAGEISVNYKALKDNLAAIPGAEEQKRPAMLRQVQSYVQELTSTHRKLDAILAQREFRRVQTPSPKDTLLARIYRWLSRHLRFSVRGGEFNWMRLLIYMLIGAAVILLAIWTLRRLRRPQEELAPREIIPFAPSARGWRTWLAEARALAQQQDWRNAIHLAYWAGISYLEEHGAWKPNRARTPREYLRLIGSRATQYPVLAALTRKLEVVWYGYGRAAEADFQETLGQLEKLGCR
jgi:uncharacterized protein DUF4129